MEKEKPTGLALLRIPFPDNQISKLPKPTKQQTDELRQNSGVGIRCQLCGGWHHKNTIHLDYVGHAALTDRLLDADPNWIWEPLSMADGLPVMDGYGGMWIRLTVCGVTRLGYGHAGDKSGGDAIKEVIGDALRNAAMRFGAALDLWHKGDLHAGKQESGEDPIEKLLTDFVASMTQVHQEGNTLEAVRMWYEERPANSNEAVEYMWGQLREYSDLRSAIKANKPQT